jgi:AmiR/NasT family two-component response regulator
VAIGVTGSGGREIFSLMWAIWVGDVIGQAKGILMERYKITGERAFLLLTRVSQTGNRKLHDIAEELVH